MVRLAAWREPFLFLVVVVVVALGQLVEDSLDTPALEMFTQVADTFRTVTVPRWTLLGLTLYMLLMLRLMRRTARKTLHEAPALVQTDAQGLETIQRRMTHLDWKTNAAVAVLALVFVLVLLLPPPLLHAPIPIVDHPGMPRGETYLPTQPLAAIIVIVAYWFVGWTALILLLTAVRLGNALGDLTTRPLNVNIFDTDNLLPFGRMALVLSLAPAGVFVILLIGLGIPTTPLAWFVFMLASIASIVALVLPLRGVHRQMEHAKDSTTREIQRELATIQTEIMDPNAPDATRTAYLSNRTNTLVNLRKVVQEAPTWPFRDTLAITRAALIAGAPLIYTVLNELIRIFLIAPLTK